MFGRWLRFCSCGTQDLGALRVSDGASAAHFASVGGDGDSAAALRTLMWLDRGGHVDLTATTHDGQTAFDLCVPAQLTYARSAFSPSAFHTKGCSRGVAGQLESKKLRKSLR